MDCECHKIDVCPGNHCGQDDEWFSKEFEVKIGVHVV